LTNVGQGFDKAVMIKASDNEWGNVINKRCPDNHFMRDIRVRHDPIDRDNREDNAGINGLSLQCCPFK
jgi:hypothetical protein